MFYNAIKSTNSSCNVYISLDQQWDRNNAASGNYDARDILDVFNREIKSEGNIIRVSPNDPNYEYFFDTPNGSCVWQVYSLRFFWNIKITVSRTKAETRAWNVQQSCMLQWLGPDFSSQFGLSII